MLSYANQKVLIVDDFPEFRMSLKNIMQQLGATDIDIAPDGKTAVNSCRKKSYDIILSDYSLGEGKDGQQLLEELVLSELLKPTTVFIMVTAENTTEMVMAAIEYAPDSYLTKPFTEDELKTRLDKLLHKKISLEKINRAIITRNYPKALKLADAMIAAKSKYSMACMRIKADLYLKMADLAKAHEVYQRVLNARPITWALLGMGKSMFAQQEYQKSIDNFNMVLKQIPNYPEALEWIAKIQVIEGQPEAAQKTLQTAVGISPKVSQRQIALGDLAASNKDYEIAKRAYRAAIKHSQDSIHQSPDSYIKLVAVIIEELTPSGGIKNKRLSTEALTHLKNLESLYKSVKEVKLRVSISRHALYHKLGRDDEKNRHIDTAKTLFAELNDSVSGHTTTDMAGAYLREGDFESCQALLTRVVEQYGDDSDIMDSIEMMIDDKEAFNRAVEASKINNEGIKLHADNKHDAAVERFRKSLSLAPENLSFKMNLVQVLLKMCEVNPDSQGAIISEIDDVLANAGQLSPRDYRYVRLQQLQQMANNIKIGLSL